MQERVFVVVGDSAKANALGRALSMAITSEQLGRTRIVAVDDGPVWIGASQFFAQDRIETFKAAAWKQLSRELSDLAESVDLTVWFSKGTSPLDKVARYLRKHSTATVVADFDDDDVAIMRSFRRQSLKNRIKMPPFRRKSPRRLLLSQALIARAAHGLTFSSHTLESVYASRFSNKSQPSAIVAHTRRPTEVTRRIGGSTLRLGFIGTIRAHKGIIHLTKLVRDDPRTQGVTFRQQWRPPADLLSRWSELDPSLPLSQVYEQIDWLVLPMDSTDPAARHQLPAKVVDAANSGCPVVATPTPVLDEYLPNGYVAIENWSDTAHVLNQLRLANVEQRSSEISRAFKDLFSPEATSKSLRTLLRRIDSAS